MTTGEGGSIDAEWVFRNAVDRTSTVTRGLARPHRPAAPVCHDHKFDPISPKEFYSLYAFFYSAAGPRIDGNALLTAPVREDSDADRSRSRSSSTSIARSPA